MSIASRTIKNVALTVSVLSILALPVSPLVVGRSIADSNASYVTLSSFSGYPAVSLSISGGSYQANEAISISATQNGVIVASSQAKANQFGEFSTTIQLPAKLAQGAVLVSAQGQTSHLVSQNNYYVNPFAPVLKTSAGQVTPFGSLTVSGSGYAPGETVNLNLAGATASVKADANGAFTNAVITTPYVPADSYKLIAAGEASGATATAYEYINAFYASASPSSYYVMPNTTLAFNGSGFAANETVNVTDAKTTKLVSSFKVASDGSFENAGGFSVPASYAGQSVKFVLTGTVSNASTTTSTVVGKYFPNVSPTSYFVMPGGSVAFNGDGFSPGESVDIYSGTTKVATVVASATGTLKAAGTVTVPSNVAGTTMPFTLTGQTSQGSGTVSVQIGNYNPQASPSGYFVMPGSTISFTGTGYAPGETINVLSGQTSLGSFSSDTSGNFMDAGSFNIAYSKANSSVSYQLVGTVSKQPISFAIGVGQLNAQITPSSYYVLPYAPFSVTASGFAPNETVTLMNGTTNLGTATTNTLGTATFVNISLPYNALGSATLTATGTTSNATTTASMGIGNYFPSVVASNYYARPGTPITLTGTGFAPNEIVTIKAGTLTQTVNADAKGNMTASLMLPFGQSKNSFDIVSTGNLSQASSTTTITLAPYLAQVSPSTYYAQPGTPVSFTGSGFAPNEKIMISLNNVVLGKETADAKGNLLSTGTYVLPFGKVAAFFVQGLTSGGTNTMNIGLAQFYAGVQLSSYYGNGGSLVTASGSGFAPNEKVTLSASTAPQSGADIATVTADAKGNFSKAITMPYAAPGKVLIGAYGAKSQASAETSYTVAQVYNSVGLGNYAVPAGKAVNITGSGFFAGEPVTVTTSRTTSSYQFKADANGNLNDSGLVLPVDLKPGMLTLTINGSYSFTSHQITIYVQDANAQ